MRQARSQTTQRQDRVLRIARCSLVATALAAFALAPLQAGEVVWQFDTGG